MPNNQIDLRATLNADDVNASAKKANAAFDSMGKAAADAGTKGDKGMGDLEKGISGAENAVKSLYKAITSIAALHLVRDTVKEFLGIITTFERSRTALTAFTGDVRVAEKLLTNIKNLAIKSPVDLDVLMDAGSLLLALGTKAQKVTPYLTAASAAVAAIGGDDPKTKMENIIQDIEKIGARGHVTGEALRNLGRNGINATQYLAEGFKITTKEVTKFTEEGLLPAEDAIQIIFDGMQKQFGGFAKASEETIGTALSNIGDRIKTTVDQISTKYRPEIKGFIDEVNQAITATGEFLVEHDKVVEWSIKLIKNLIELYALAKFAKWAVEFELWVRAMEEGFAQIEPWVVAVVEQWGAYISIIGAAAAAWHTFAEGEEHAAAAQKQIKDIGFPKAKGMNVPGQVPQNVQDQRTLDEISAEARARLMGPPEEAKQSAADKLAIERGLVEDKAAREARKKREAADKTLKNYYIKAFIKSQDTPVGRILETYNALKDETKVADYKQKLLAFKGFILNVTEEVHKEQLKMAKEFEKEEAEDFSHLDHRSELLKDSLAREADAIKMNIETLRKNYETAFDPSAEHARKLAELKQLPDDTAAQQADIEQQKLDIEKDFIMKSLELHIKLNEWKRDSDLTAYNLSVDQRAAIRDAATAEDTRLRQTANEALITEEEQTAGAVVNIWQKEAKEAREAAESEQKKIFGTFKDEGGKIFDALLSKDKWKGVANVFKTAILTALKDIVSSQIAVAFMKMMGVQVALRAPAGASPFGQLLGSLGFGSIPIVAAAARGSLPAVAAAGQAGAAGQAAAVAAATGGVAPSIPGFGQNGIMNQQTLAQASQQAAAIQQITAEASGNPAAAPGNTGGGVGGVLGTASSAAGLAKYTGLSGVLGKYLTASPTALGIGALGLGGGIAGVAGAWKMGQSGNKVGKALAVPVGAVSGAIAGSALTVLFPALLAAGPAGWIVGAAIGAAIGIMSVMKDSAIDKVQAEVEKTYGFKVDRSFAKNVLYPIIKEKYGGDIRMGLRAPEVREMLKLYAMSRGINTSGIVASATPSTFGSVNGSFQQMPTFQNGQAIYPTQMTSTAVGGNVTIALDGPATTKLLSGQAVTAVANNPRVVSTAADAGAADRATRSSSVPLLDSNYVVA